MSFLLCHLPVNRTSNTLKQKAKANLDADLPHLCNECRRERADFRAGKTRASPACVELFRRAFANDRLAWNAIFGEIFAQEIRQYVRNAQQAYTAHAGFAPFDLDDAEQETRMAFWLYAARAENLLASGQLEPIMAYLKSCAKTGVGKAARRNRQTAIPLSQLSGQEENSTNEPTPTKSDGAIVDTQFEEQLVARQTMLDELRKLVTVDPEPQQAEAIVIDCFLNETPPRDLLTLHPTLFADITIVNQALQRIRRRANNQLYFQRLLQRQT